MLSIRGLNGGTKTVTDRTMGELSAHIHGDVLQPGAAEYDSSRRIFNAMIDRRPALIVRCADSSDVSNAVDFARDHQLLLAVRSGGHSVAGTAVCEGGVVIDLTRMKDVRVDSVKKVALAGAGATLGDLDRNTSAVGLICPAGIVSTTGIAGLTLGGGRGWLRGKLGLTVDNLLSAELVTADGRIRRVSGSEHSDLFWAIRGGGGNFGVATEFEFRLHDLPREVVFCDPLYSIEYAGDVVTGWREFMRSAPDELTSELFFWTVPDDIRFPEWARGVDVVIPRCVYYGRVAEGIRVIAPLRHLAPTLCDLSGPVSFLSVQHALDPYLPYGKVFCYWKALSFNQLSDDVRDVIIDQFSNRPHDARICPMALHYFNGESRRVAPTDTAYADRDSWFEFEYNTCWSDRASSSGNSQWVKRAWAQLRDACATSRGGYLNVESYADDGIDLVKQTFGVNYPRLLDIKRRYDPSNLFRLNANIRPT